MSIMCNVTTLSSRLGVVYKGAGVQSANQRGIVYYTYSIRVA